MTSSDRRTSPRRDAARPRRRATAAAMLLSAAGVAAGVSACGSSPGTPTAGPSAVTSATAAATGTPPPGATSTAASPKAPASSFAASVSAEASAVRSSASAALKSVPGHGNAVGDVRLTGVPTAASGGRPATTVRITNHSGSRASYAVRIDFTDSSGKTVESTVVGVRDLEPGRTATLLAFGSTATRTPTTPKVAQAQRT